MSADGVAAGTVCARAEADTRQSATTGARHNALIDFRVSRFIGFSFGVGRGIASPEE